MSVIDYSVLMGHATHAAPGPFATQLNGYIRHLVEERGWDFSGRALERESESARKKDYWKKLLDNRAAMTTNDIAVLAKVFGMNPFDLVKSARSWTPGNVTQGPWTVGGSRDNPAIEERAVPRVARSAEKEQTDEQ